LGFSQYSNYNTAINYFVTVPKYRIQAQEIARQEGLLGNNSGESSKKNRGRKTISKQEEEAILKQIVEQKLDIKGGYKKPSKFENDKIQSHLRLIVFHFESLLGITRVLWLQLILFPYNIFLKLKWQIRWFIKFHLNKNELGDDEKIYLICRNLKIHREQYESLPEKEYNQIWDREIWIKENFLQWKQEKDEEQKKKLNESGRYKAYRRYMKSGGPGQITFDGD
jgi:DnaJ family protein C protein 25